VGAVDNAAILVQLFVTVSLLELSSSCPNVAGKSATDFIGTANAECAENLLTALTFKFQVN